jgi:membrane-associated phospholipid phosphatase
MAMAGLIWLDYAASKTKPLWSKAITFILALAFPLSIAYSRIVLGVHSFNQITYGLLLGAWIAGTMHFCVRSGINRHIRKLTRE